MDSKKIRPSMKIRKEISEIIEGMKDSEQCYEDPMQGLMLKAKELVIQEMLEQEVTEYLGRESYERNPEKVYYQGYRNGYEPKQLKTPEGRIELSVPQVRGGDAPYRSQLKSFFKNNTEVLEQLAVEMYVRGLSTRDIEEALETCTGEKILSHRSISTITEVLWEDYERFCKRDLSNYEVVYIVVDAVYESMRAYVKSNEAILVAYGILSDGRKILLHMEVGQKESYEFCKEFLRDMVSRGLNVPVAVNSDGAPGMIKAVNEIFPHSLRLRCWVHKMCNLANKLPAEIWEQIKPHVQAVRDSLSYDEGLQKLDTIVKNYEAKYPSFVKCLLDDHEALLNVLHLPRRHQRSIRTTNLVERTFVEERRRTKIIPQFLTEKSCLKLAFSVLYRASLRWRKIPMSEFELAKLRQLKKYLGITLEQETTKKSREVLSHA
jgi:putative transposase